MTSADTTHALWRPGIGLSLWFTDADGAPTDAPRAESLPTPVAEIVSGRTLRRTISVSDDTGRVQQVGSLTLGPAAVTALLDDATLPQIGELGYYSYLAASVRRFVAAGAVTPTLEWTTGSWATRWTPLPSTHWRSWLAGAVAAAPGVVTENGGGEAIGDFCRELIDHECRRRCAGLSAGVFRSALVRSLLPDAGDEMPMSSDRAVVGCDRLDRLGPTAFGRTRARSSCVCTSPNMPMTTTRTPFLTTAGGSRCVVAPSTASTSRSRYTDSILTSWTR